MGGEDLFAQQCLDSVGVPRVEQYDISTDGQCEADRPLGEKKNKKYVPDCATTSTPQIHPLKTPDVFGACYDATVAAFGAGGSLAERRAELRECSAGRPPARETPRSAGQE